MSEHNPVARYCIVITTPPLPASLLRDDLCCPACCDLLTLIALDPDFKDDVMSPHPCPTHGTTERSGS